MKTALIAIPTNGKREDILDVIKNIHTSLEEINVKAVFSICADETDSILSKYHGDTIFFSLRPEKFDYTYHNIEAIKRGILHFNPDFVSIIADDFVIPATKFGNLIRPLLDEYDAVFGSWGSNEIAATYPKFQYVSELFISRMANVAPKSSSVNYNSMVSYTFDYKSDFSNIVQLFTGLFAFKIEKWNLILDRLIQIYGSTKLGWSLEIPVFLSSHDKGMRIISVACDKVKEDNSPIYGERITRLTQIKDVFESINKYLEFTNQYEKLNKLVTIQSEMIKVVEDILNKSGA